MCWGSIRCLVLFRPYLQNLGPGVFDQSPSSFCHSTSQTDLLQNVVLQNVHTVMPKMCSVLKGVSSTNLNGFTSCKTCLHSFKYANAHYAFPRGGRVRHHEVAKLFECKSLVWKASHGTRGWRKAFRERLHHTWILIPQNLTLVLLPIYSFF